MTGWRSRDLAVAAARKSAGLHNVPHMLRGSNAQRTAQLNRWSVGHAWRSDLGYLWHELLAARSGLTKLCWSTWLAVSKNHLNACKMPTVHSATTRVRPDGRCTPDRGPHKRGPAVPARVVAAPSATRAIPLFDNRGAPWRRLAGSARPRAEIISSYPCSPPCQGDPLRQPYGVIVAVNHESDVGRCS
jgi:hypothetical protein